MHFKPIASSQNFKTSVILHLKKCMFFSYLQFRIILLEEATFSGLKFLLHPFPLENFQSRYLSKTIQRKIFFTGFIRLCIKDYACIMHKRTERLHIFLWS